MLQVEMSTAETWLATVTSRNVHNWECYKSKFPQLKHVFLLMFQFGISTTDTCLATAVTNRNFHNCDCMSCYWRYKCHLLLMLRVWPSTTETRIATDVTSVNFHSWNTVRLTANVTSEISTPEICLAANEAIKRRVHKWNTSGCWCNKGGDIMATDVARRRGVWLVKLKAWISTIDAGRLAAVDVTSVAALGHDWDHASIYDILLSRSPFFCGEWCRKARLGVRSSKEHHLLGQNTTCEFSG